MLGTFSAWRLGTLQSRALPLARCLARRGLRVALITFPWDAPSEAGVRDVSGGVLLLNTPSARLRDAPRLIRETSGWLRRHAPGAVHVWKPKGFGGLVAQSLLGSMPVVVDSDDWEGDGGWNARGQYSLPQRRLFDWQERSLLARADAVSAASTLLARRAESLRLNRETPNVWRLPNALEDDWRARLAAGHCGAVGKPPSIVIYSRYAEFSADWLPRFTRALAAQCPLPLVLRLVGNAPAHESFGNVHVERLGYLALSALPAVLGSASLAIYPYEDTLVTRSKQSVKLLELMAAGCPVLASAVGDVPLTLGDAGITLSNSAPEEFAAAAARLLEEPTRLAALGSAAQARIAACFGFETLADTLLEVYASVGMAPASARAS